MALEEEKIRLERQREEEARLRQQADHEKEEDAILQYQLSLLADHSKGSVDRGLSEDRAGSSNEPPPARLSAAEFRQWEDWEWHNLLNEPPQKRRRSVMQVTVSGTDGRDSPSVVRTLSVPMASPGAMTLKLDFTMKVEQYPDDVETVILDSGETAPAAVQLAVAEDGEVPDADAAVVSGSPVAGEHPMDDQDTVPFVPDDRGMVQQAWS